MRVNKNGQRALDRETFKTLESTGIDMSGYYMEGQSGGLINEAITLGQFTALEQFVRDNGTHFRYSREDGTQFDIRINGAEVKK